MDLTIYGSLLCISLLPFLLFFLFNNSIPCANQLTGFPETWFGVSSGNPEGLAVLNPHHVSQLLPVTGDGDRHLVATPSKPPSSS